MPCKQTGMCCRSILLNRSPEEIAGLRGSDLDQGRINSDAVFCGANWVPISVQEAVDGNPYVLLKLSMAKTRGETYHIYKCLQFDEGSNLCKAHEVKPKVCSRYPYYNDDPITTDFLTWPGCGYIEDILERRKQNV